MSIEIKIPKEINDYKEKFWGGMTLRGLGSVAISAVIAVPLFMFGHRFFPPEIINGIILFFCLPILGLGFKTEHQGMKTEEFFAVTIKHLLHPQRRVYTELPVFWHARNEIIEETVEYEKLNEILKVSSKKKRGKKWQ